MELGKYNPDDDRLLEPGTKKSYTDAFPCQICERGRFIANYPKSVVTYCSVLLTLLVNISFMALGVCPRPQWKRRLWRDLA